VKTSAKLQQKMQKQQLKSWIKQQQQNLQKTHPLPHEEIIEIPTTRIRKGLPSTSINSISKKLP
jgi:hypothetical protein